FSSRRRHTRCYRDWSSDVCSYDLAKARRVQDDRDEYSDRDVEDHVRERPEKIEREHPPEAEVGDDCDAVRDQRDEVFETDEVGGDRKSVVKGKREGMGGVQSVERQ